MSRGEGEGEEIVRIAARGDGLTASGQAVPLAAPGDRIGPGGILVPGPHHATPPCRHFPACGGCQLQHVDDTAYAGFIVARIAGALAAQGISAPEILPPRLSPPGARRRSSLRAERRGGGVTIGFNAAASHDVVDMRECHVLAPALFALVAPLRRLLVTLIPNRRAAAVHMTLADQGVDLVLEKVSAEGLVAAELLTAFAEAHGLARLSIDEGYGAEARWEPRPVTVALGGVAVPLPQGAFLQATADGEAALVAAVSRAVAGAATVADLFAGLGTFALPLSATARILAVEGSRAPALALKLAADAGQRPIAVEHRDLFRRPLTTVELQRFDAVILDPPRAGAKEQVAELARSAVRCVAYVSCNPATFARDARSLIDEGYGLAWISPVGQFRWSTHVELVGAFARLD